MPVTTVDMYVSMKLKIRRKHLGITQKSMGKLMDISFQQVQKYENGINKISAGKLYTISEILNIPISYFFDGYEEVKSKFKKYNYTINAKNKDEVAKVFKKIKNKCKILM